MSKLALITGSSSGIGLELAKIMAANGHDLFLTARSENILLKLKSEIEKNHKVKVHIFPKDLSRINAPQEIYEEIKKQGLEVEYLVNNAGFGDFGAFYKSSWDRTREMIELNITSLTHLTRLFLPDMIKKKSGKILNVASVAAFLPGPMMSVYYATKAYVLHFSEAIRAEVQKTGVTITILCPGPTASGFQAAAGFDGAESLNKMRMPSSLAVAQCGYKAMMKGKPLVIHGRGYSTAIQAIKFFPRTVVASLVKKVQEERKN
jgi:short-subunit dehydrogenase